MLRTIRNVGFVMAVGLGGCVGLEPGAEIPSPDEFEGKADGEAFTLRKTPLAYGESVKGSLRSARVYAAFAFHALEGADLSLSGTAGRALAVYGPEDRDGKWGPLSIASSTAKTAGKFTIPEDGRYIAIIGGKTGAFELSLACKAGCDVDPDAGKLQVNRATAAQLRSARLDSAELLSYREQFGLIGSLAEVGLDGKEEDLSPTLGRVFFGSKLADGWGWAPESRARKAFLQRPGAAEVDFQPQNVALPVVDLFRRATREIDVAMYGMSLSTDEGVALLEAAARGIKVKVYLDVSERDPEGNPYTATVIKQLLTTPNVEVRVPRYSSKMMHEKFGIVDGLHLFSGSANVSKKARDVYTEDRFVFMNAPHYVAPFAGEWDRLWNRLGKDAATLLQ